MEKFPENYEKLGKNGFSRIDKKCEVFKLKILLVDDESDFLEQAKIFLKKEEESLEIETTTSAERGLNLLEENDYDAVVSDYQMPGMDGLEFLESVREDIESDIPFIIFTGKGREEVAMEALNLGADRYLQKGMDPKSQYGVLADAIDQEVTHKRTRKRFEETKERYEELFRGANELVVTTDHEGYIKRVNEKTMEVSGYSEEELIGESVLKIAHPEEREKFILYWQEILDEKKETEKTLRAVDKEGEVLWLKTGGRPILDNGEVVEIQYNALDITERKEAEEELREAKQNYQELFENSAEALFVHDVDTGEILDVNQRMCEIYGYSYEEAMELTIGDLSSGEHAYTQEEAEKRIQRAKMEGPQTFEWRAQKKDGTLFWVEVTLKQAEIGGKKRVLASVRDITDRKKAEEEAREKGERYEELFKGANELIVTTDREGYIKRVNRRTLEQFGYSEDDLVGESVLKIAHPEDKEKFIEFWKEVIEEKEEVEKTVRVVGKSGSVAWLRAGGRPILKDGEIVEIQYTSQDITDLVKTRRREEFLHSLLRHDLRNKISIIDGYHDLLQDTDLSDEQEKFVQKASKATRYSDDLIEKVRTLRGIGEEEPKEVDLEPLIREAVENCKSTTSGMDFQIEMECPVEGCRVEAGPLLNEVFSNLLENSARHSEGSKVRISNKEADGEMVCIVEDDGKGIPDEEKEKIFEKGYRKGENAGSGLGMYLVKEITNTYGGSVEVKDSQLGGTRFDVHLKKA